MIKVKVTDATEEEYEALGEKLIENSISNGSPDYMPDNKYFRVYDGKKLIGEAITTELRGSVELDLIFVEKDYRRKGVGKALLAGIEEYSKSVGAKGIKLWSSSWEDNEFYKVCGFEEVIKIPLAIREVTENKETYEILYFKNL